MSVREPAADGNRVLRVKDVRGWRIVNDDRFSEVTAYLRKILLDWLDTMRIECEMKYGATNLDVVSLVIVAALAEEAMVHYIMNIQLIQQRVTIL